MQLSAFYSGFEGLRRVGWKKPTLVRDTSSFDIILNWTLNEKPSNSKQASWTPSLLPSSVVSLSFSDSAARILVSQPPLLPLLERPARAVINARSVRSHSFVSTHHRFLSIVLKMSPFSKLQGQTDVL